MRETDLAMPVNAYLRQKGPGEHVAMDQPVGLVLGPGQFFGVQSFIREPGEPA